MKWGFNFEMGPFETWDAIDLVKSVDKMKKDGFLIPEKSARCWQPVTPHSIKQRTANVFSTILLPPHTSRFK